MDYIFEKGKFTEGELEQAIIELFEQQGYTYVPGESIHRRYEDILLTDDIRSYLVSRYNNDLSDVEIQRSLINCALSTRRLCIMETVNPSGLSRKDSTLVAMISLKSRCMWITLILIIRRTISLK